MDLDALLAPCVAVFGVPAIYTPAASGAPQSVTWIYYEAVPGSRLNDLHTPHDGPMAEVAVSLLPSPPLNGDTATMGDRAFTVKKAELDHAGLFWLIELVKVLP